MPALFLLFMMLAFLVSPSPSLAIMPPHITGSVPESGGVLTADTVLLQGYTLYRPEQDQLELLDATSGEPAAWEVAGLTCRDEGDWEKAQTDDGAIQFNCDLAIRLLDPVPGHAYTLTFLDWTIGFTYSPGD